MRERYGASTALMGCSALPKTCNGSHSHTNPPSQKSVTQVPERAGASNMSIPFRTVADLRPHSPYSIYAAPVDPHSKPWETSNSVEHRFAVRGDADNDERVLMAAAALYFHAPHEFRFVHAYAVSQDTLTVWQLGFGDAVLRAVEGAIGRALRAISDLWTVNIVENYLPPRANSFAHYDPEYHLQRSFMHAALVSERSADDLIHIAESVATKFEQCAQDFVLDEPIWLPTHLHIRGLKPAYRPTCDADLAALHQLFELGSFNRGAERPWRHPRSQSSD